MVYGHKPYENINLDGPVLECRFEEVSFPELNRHEIFDSLISACWYNVYPTMALVVYDFKRKTKHIASASKYKFIDRAKERKTCEALIRKGILGPELALRFQPLWRKYLHAARNMLASFFSIGLPRFQFWPWR